MGELICYMFHGLNFVFELDFGNKLGNANVKLF